MTASTDPQPPETEQDTEQDTEPDGPSRSRARRRPPAWLVGAGAVLVAIVVVALLRGGEDEPPTSDLSTPEGAAEAFAKAAAAGDIDGLLAVTCLGDNGCAAEHGGGASPEQVSAAKKVLADNVRALGSRFGYAEFTPARAGAEPGTREVDYRLPGMPANERNYLIFVKYQDRWLYIATGGAETTTSPAPPVPTT